MRSGRRRAGVADLRMIRASEIGEYAYCSRAWWYKHVVRLPAPDGGATDTRLAQGIRAHHRHGRSVRASVALRTLGILLAVSGLLAIALALVFGTA
ncbi:MAG TPA: hypothetical protein VM409_04855 [Chloroflexia bacterium]|nr:hypothetical protein [Chloroflexia bacterium]